MVGTLNQFQQLTDAEQYFQFFDLAYDPQVVNINRLHILKKFSQSLQEINAQLAAASDEEKLSSYKAALEASYTAFISSTPLEQKLFKVFHQKPNNVVLLGDIGMSEEE
jgi:nitrogenase-stabilizing/protective protein